MVLVNMRVSHEVNQLSHLHAHHIRHDMRQQRVRSDIKGNPEAHVTGPLVQRTRKLVFGTDVELEEHMTGRKSHLVEVHWVPGRDQHSSGIRVSPQLLEHIVDLVDSFVPVVGVMCMVFRAEVPPLEAVDWSQVTGFSMEEAARVKERS